MQTYEISKALVLNQEGKLLLLRRSQSDKRRPGQWDMPGGRVDPGEDIRQALVRETQEEAGIEVPLKQFRLIYGLSKVRENVSITWNFFTVQLHDTPEVILSFEHSEYRWMTPAEALEAILYDIHQEVLGYAMQNGLLEQYNDAN